jgi:hypothetical protein
MLAKEDTTLLELVMQDNTQRNGNNQRASN